jgi:hypothetical protein
MTAYAPIYLVEIYVFKRKYAIDKSFDMQPYPKNYWKFWALIENPKNPIIYEHPYFLNYVFEYYSIGILPCIVTSTK